MQVFTFQHHATLSGNLPTPSRLPNHARGPCGKFATTFATRSKHQRKTAKYMAAGGGRLKEEGEVKIMPLTRQGDNVDIKFQNIQTLTLIPTG